MIAISRPYGRLAPILFMVVLQTGHFPCTAGLPFFIVICFGSVISRFSRHLTQYASKVSSLQRRFFLRSRRTPFASASSC